MTLASLGLSAQTVRGAKGTVDIELPAPPGPLAAQGSLIRVFFSHSTGLDSKANLEIAVNGVLLDRVPLNQTTAAGGVFDIEVPTNLLHQQAANQLETQWSLDSQGGSEAYGTLQPATLVDYAIAGEPNSLATYPYSMLEGPPANVLHLGVVLPADPDRAEVGAAMSLVANLARQIPGRVVEPQLLSATPADPSDEPVLVVGRTGTVPLVGRILRSAGFRLGGGVFQAPGSANPVTPRSGVLVAGTLPTNRKADASLITGQTDEGLTRATSALLAAPPGTYPGSTAIIAGPVVEPAASAPPTVSALIAAAQVAPGQLEQRIAFGLPLLEPSSGGGSLQLALDPTAGGRGTFTLQAYINGHALRPVMATASGAPFHLRVSIPSAYLRPGSNGVALDFRRSGTSALAPASIDLSETHLATGTPRAGTTLQDLPNPFLGTGNPPTVVLAKHRPALLEAALRGAAALGSRAVTPVPLFHVSSAAGPLDIGRSGLIVFGTPGGGSTLRISGSPEMQVDAPAGPAGRGWLEEVGLPGAEGRVLWIDGTTVGATNQAASLLGSARSRGTVMVVQGGAPAATIEGARTEEGVAAPEALTYLLAVAMSVWLAILVMVEVRRRRVRRRVGGA
ncbi:MAG: cellulose biosynthesis cyclic di-GMP-binding regulatory protein BcsB [Candidatus Dormibacteraceae bacterium]